MTVRYTNGKGHQKLTTSEYLSFKIIRWVGTPYSIILHTLFFILIPMLTFLGFELRTVLLIFTTWLSIEAIYLAIFIQMSVNKNTESLEDVEEDIEDIQEDVQGLEGEVEEISEDIDEDELAHKALLNIASEIKNIQTDLEILKKKGLL